VFHFRSATASRKVVVEALLGHEGAKAEAEAAIIASAATDFMVNMRRKE